MRRGKREIVNEEREGGRYEEGKDCRYRNIIYVYSYFSMYNNVHIPYRLVHTHRKFGSFFCENTRKQKRDSLEQERLTENIDILH